MILDALLLVSIFVVALVLGLFAALGAWAISDRFSKTGGVTRNSAAGHFSEDK